MFFCSGGPVLLRSPGNMLIFWMSCGSLLPPLVLCYNGKERCTIQENKQYHVSPVLESLRCYNDYSSYVRCSWEESPHASSQAPLALYYWDDTENRESLCKPYGQPALNANNSKLTAQCQYNTRDFGINTNHVFFFKTSCPPALLLSKNLRVRPPVRLSQQPVERGGRLLSWESPYPPTSLLTPTLNYQVNYRRSNQDDWTAVKVQDTQLSVEAEAQVPGCQYEAKVRAKGKTGLWSEWSSLVTWMTEDDPVPGPSSAQCVVDDEKVVTCSWEVKRDLAQFLTFHLSCKHNHTAPAQKCCVNTMVSAPSRGPMLKYSCSFPVPDSEQLEVELIPTCNSKTFKTHKNIRPNRPLHVQIEARDGNWILKWNPPKSNFELTYQVHYWSNDTQEDTRFLNVSQGSLSLSILGRSLRPSECYLVKVRALVVPGRGDTFEGPPSEWTDPVEWTSRPASWSITTFLYVFISVLVAIVFIALYVTIPACHRRVVLWEVSVPSPLKSKALGEVIKKSPDRLLFPESERSEKTYICSVQTLESKEDISLCFSCSSDNPLWLTPDVKANGLFHSITKEGWKKYDPNFSSLLLLSVDRSCPPALDSSGFSFSGPYILCGDSSPAPSEFLSLEPPCEESDNTLSNSDPSSPSSSERSSPSLLESSEGYVAMPQVSAGLSRSTEGVSDGLMSAVVTEDSKNTGNNNGNNVIIMAWPKSELLPPRPSSMSTCSPPSENEDPPPAYMPPATTTPLTLPPVNSTLHTSGYCFLPAVQALGGWGHVQSSGPPKGISQEQQARRRERRQEEQCKEDPYVRLSQLAT